MRIKVKFLTNFTFHSIVEKDIWKGLQMAE